VPSSYDGSTAVPLVILLHGYSATGNPARALLQPPGSGRRKGFPVRPTRTGLKDAQNNQFWNASDACCDFANTGVDDSAYLASLVDEISAQVRRGREARVLRGPLQRRLHVVPHGLRVTPTRSPPSSAWRARCPSTRVSASPAHPSPCCRSTATADDTILYDGGSTLSKYPSAQQSVDAWVNSNGCNKTPDLSSPPLDLDTGLAGDETSVSQWKAGCQPGGDVELWTLEGGGHIPALSSNFAPGVIDFLLSHPKP
jgi:polyhydroxybutyrate depolymerase